MPIDPETKSEYNSIISGHNGTLSGFDKEISTLKKRILKEKQLAPLLRVGIVAVCLKRAELRIKMNNLSQKMLKLKNNSFLDSAKKELGDAFAAIESIVTLRSDESINFNRDMLDKIKPFNARQRLNMVKHLKKILEDLISGYGENTKWKWSFPDLWTKLAVSAKNIFDFKEYSKTKDPRMEFYYDLQEFLKLIKETLFFAAGENANKFRLSTKSPADMLAGIRLLEDLRRIASLTGDAELVKKSKSGIDSYRATVEAEEKEKEKEKKRAKKKKHFFKKK